jgi:hypothetical protein
LTPQEIAAFVLALPLAALTAQVLWQFLQQPWQLDVWPQRLLRLVALIWLLAVGMLVIGACLAQWRRRQMDATAARMLLQDSLWRETRREQSRVFRWLAWRRNREQGR